MQLLRKPLAHYVGFIVTYLLLVVFLPANRAAMRMYGLTSLRYHFLFLVVALPFIGIWFAAFYGFSRLRSYARALRNTVEGEDFQLLAKGSGWLTYSLPISAISSIILNSFANTHDNFHHTAVVINNYISLLSPLVAFTILGTGARQLATRSQVRLSMAAGRGLIFIFALLGVVYCYIAFRHLGSLNMSAANNAYFLPVWLIVISIIIPFLYAWYVGLFAAYEIVIFAKKSKGVIYVKALRYLGFGVAAVIVSSIALQYISSIMPRSGSTGLSYILLSIFVFELFSAGGYSFIALGARRLQRIEEV